MSDKRAYQVIAIVFGCLAIGFLASGNTTWVAFLPLAIVFGALSTDRGKSGDEPGPTPSVVSPA